ncbi:MAG: hypothetical protein CL580_00620 [Alteromonadaceae bacterium]|nr:hypothetical protein [Alteromonadaceae bacterium]
MLFNPSAKIKQETFLNRQLAEEIKYACQEILNRHYSIQVSQRLSDEDPWWIKKISRMERNCDLFLKGDYSQIFWDHDFGAKIK